MSGTRLWRINLRKNIRVGEHHTQFTVYDLNGDDMAEVAMKTADGTVDGTGTVIGSSTADYSDSSGVVLTGPEFLTVFRGSKKKSLWYYLNNKGDESMETKIVTLPEKRIVCIENIGDYWGLQKPGRNFIKSSVKTTCISMDGNGCRFFPTTLTAYPWRKRELMLP